MQEEWIVNEWVGEWESNDTNESPHLISVQYKGKKYRVLGSKKIIITIIVAIIVP